MAQVPEKQHQKHQKFILSATRPSWSDIILTIVEGFPGMVFLSPYLPAHLDSSFKHFEKIKVPGLEWPFSIRVTRMRIQKGQRNEDGGE